MSQKPESARCPECGRRLPPSQRFCFCGHDLQAPSIPLPRPGMRGWLLFFCLQLFVFNPLGIGWLAIADRRALDVNEVLRSALEPMSGVDTAVRVALVVIGIAGGALLVTRHRRAVPFIRLYLVVFAITHVALASLPLLLDLPRPMRGPMVGALLYRAGVLVVPWAGFWFLYFGHSRHVKLTYGGISPPLETLVEDTRTPAPEAPKQAAPASRPDAILQITVHRSGAVSVNGQRVDLDRLGRALDDLKRREGEVWYYGPQESPDQETPGVAAEAGARVLAALRDRGLPVKRTD